MEKGKNPSITMVQQLEINYGSQIDGNTSEPKELKQLHISYNLLGRFYMGQYA